jgi:hypothetical protein
VLAIQEGERREKQRSSTFQPGGNVAIAEANERKGSLSFMPKDGKSFVSVTYEEARDYIATVMSSD